MNLLPSSILNERSTEELIWLLRGLLFTHQALHAAQNEHRAQRGIHGGVRSQPEAAPQLSRQGHFFGASHSLSCSRFRFRRRRCLFRFFCYYQSRFPSPSYAFLFVVLPLVFPASDSSRHVRLAAWVNYRTDQGQENVYARRTGTRCGQHVSTRSTSVPCRLTRHTKAGTSTVTNRSKLRSIAV